MQVGNAIEVHDITKRFKVYYDRGKTLKERLITPGRNKAETRQVLKGISFDVKKGEAIGIIGKNGCGKSTTLKLLTRIIYPDSGSIELNGRVSSLLELGAGFHPDMSGRENIYLNAAIFGLTHREIEEKVDEIINFSELEDFIENPVRTYSSGMYMRLAFAVAINVRADILLIDEILAVGDVSFQTKCFEKLKEIKASGTTIVIVSHSLGQIEQICDKSIWLEEGRIKKEGISKFVHEEYLAAMEDRRLDQIVKEKENEIIKNSKDEITKDNERITEKKQDKIKLQPNWCINAIRSGNRKILFSKVELRNQDNRETMIFDTGDCLIVHMEYKTKYENIEGNFGVGINRDDGVYCYGTNTLIEFKRMIKVKQSGVIEMKIPNLTLLPAKYILDVAIHTEDEIPIDRIHHILEFQIRSNKKDFGVARLENEWKGTDIGEIK